MATVETTVRAGSAQQLRPAMALGSADGLRVVVLREPARPGLLEADLGPLVNCRPVACSAPNRPGIGAIAAGSRWTDDASGLELVCVRAGSGPLTYAGRPLRPTIARPVGAGTPRRLTVPAYSIAGHQGRAEVLRRAGRTRWITRLLVGKWRRRAACTTD